MPAIPIIAVAASVAGTAVAGYSAYSAGQSQKALDNYNAAIAQRQSQADLQAGATKALLQRQENARILAREGAVYAAAGVVGSTGSPLLEQVQDAGRLELRAQQTEYEAGIGATNQQSQSQLDLMSGRIASEAGGLNAASSILNGAGSAYAGYKGYG